MKIRDIVQISIFAVFTVVCAKVVIPFPVIPVTLQTFAVILSGLLLGAERGALSQLLYLGMGMIGVPVFSTVSGPAIIFSPTFGYIVGFVLCAWICGKIAEKCVRPLWKHYFVISLIGVAFIYALGIGWLFAAGGLWTSGTKTSFAALFSVGFISMLPAEIAKATLAAAVAVKIKKRGLLQ